MEKEVDEEHAVRTDGGLKQHDVRDICPLVAATYCMCHIYCLTVRRRRSCDVVDVDELRVACLIRTWTCSLRATL